MDNYAYLTGSDAFSGTGLTTWFRRTIWDYSHQNQFTFTTINLSLMNIQNFQKCVIVRSSAPKFLKWQPCLFPVMAIFFVYVNLPTVFLMSFNKLASCPVPDINLHLSFYCGRPSFSFSLLKIVHNSEQTWQFRMRGDKIPTVSGERVKILIH